MGCFYRKKIIKDEFHLVKICLIGIRIVIRRSNLDRIRVTSTWIPQLCRNSNWFQIRRFGKDILYNICFNFFVFSLEVDLGFIFSLGHTVDIRDVFPSVSLSNEICWGLLFHGVFIWLIKMN